MERVNLDIYTLTINMIKIYLLPFLKYALNLNTAKKMPYKFEV